MPKLGAKADLVGLNFGGERAVMVKRSLLLQFEGSVLADMFSGQPSGRLDRDGSGNFFFDYFADIMVPLVEFPRLYRDIRGLAPLPWIAATTGWLGWP